MWCCSTCSIGWAASTGSAVCHVPATLLEVLLHITTGWNFTSGVKDSIWSDVLRFRPNIIYFFFFWVFFSSCRTEALLDAMSQTLKSLEDRYLKMKMMILEGVPLDNLKPLSVDTKRLTAATCYRPSLVCRSHVPREETQNKHLLLVSQFDQHFVSFSDLWGFFRWRQAWVLFQVSVIHSWD